MKINSPNPWYFRSPVGPSQRIESPTLTSFSSFCVKSPPSGNSAEFLYILIANYTEPFLLIGEIGVYFLETVYPLIS